MSATEVTGGSALAAFLLGGDGTASSFLTALEDATTQLYDALEACVARPGFLLDSDDYLLRDDALDTWLRTQYAGPSLGRLRSAALAQIAERGASPLDVMVLRIQHDLQGPLNMPLYSDLREEIRKRARIVIRETLPDRIRQTVERYLPDYARPANLPQPTPRISDQVAELATHLSKLDDLISAGSAPAVVGPSWGRTGPSEALRSLQRFVKDLRFSTQGVDDLESLAAASIFGAFSGALADESLLPSQATTITAQLFDTYRTIISSR